MDGQVIKTILTDTEVYEDCLTDSVKPILFKVFKTKEEANNQPDNLVEIEGKRGKRRGKKPEPVKEPPKQPYTFDAKEDAELVPVVSGEDW